MSHAEDPDFSERVEMELDSEWQSFPLRCPRCGNRSAGLGGLWVRAIVRLDAQGRPTVLLAPDYDGARIDCARCDYAGAFRSFLPPWHDPATTCVCDDIFCSEPLPLTEQDRQEAAAWCVAQAADGLRA